MALSILGLHLEPRPREKPGSPKLRFIPNLITFSGFASGLTGVYGCLNAWSWKVNIAFFIYALLTDGLDGLVARHYKWVTNSGKVLDPIKDKSVFLMVAYVVFHALQDKPQQLQYAIFLMAAVLVFETISAIYYSKMKIKSITNTSKWSMVAQSVCMGALLIEGLPGQVKALCGIIILGGSLVRVGSYMTMCKVTNHEWKVEQELRKTEVFRATKYMPERSIK